MPLDLRSVALSYRAAAADWSAEKQQQQSQQQQLLQQKEDQLHTSYDPLTKAAIFLSSKNSKQVQVEVQTHEEQKPLSSNSSSVSVSASCTTNTYEDDYHYEDEEDEEVFIVGGKLISNDRHLLRRQFQRHTRHEKDQRHRITHALRAAVHRDITPHPPVELPLTYAFPFHHCVGYQDGVAKKPKPAAPQPNMLDPTTCATPAVPNVPHLQFLGRGTGCGANSSNLNGVPLLQSQYCQNPVFPVRPSNKPISYNGIAKATGVPYVVDSCFINGNPNRKTVATITTTPTTTITTNTTTTTKVSTKKTSLRRERYEHAKELRRQQEKDQQEKEAQEQLTKQQKKEAKQRKAEQQQQQQAPESTLEEQDDQPTSLPNSHLYRSHNIKMQRLATQRRRLSHKKCDLFRLPLLMSIFLGAKAPSAQLLLPNQATPKVANSRRLSRHIASACKDKKVVKPLSKPQPKVFVDPLNHMAQSSCPFERIRAEFFRRFRTTVCDRAQSLWALPVSQQVKEIFVARMSSTKLNAFNLDLIFHGTNISNISNILRIGLQVPGNNGVRVVNGSAHGTGIYASTDVEFAKSYFRGPSAPMVLVCAFIQHACIKKPSHIHVIPEADLIVPMGLAYFG